MLDPDNNTTATAIRSVTSDARVFADSDVVVTVTLVGEPRLGAGKNYRRNRGAHCSNVVDFGSSGAAIGKQKFKVVVAMLLSLVFSKKLIVEIEFVDFLSINGEFTIFQHNCRSRR